MLLLLIDLINLKSKSIAMSFKALFTGKMEKSKKIIWSV